MKTNGKALVIGATGLLGYGVTNELNSAGWSVNAIGKENLNSSRFFSDGVNYVCGDFYDETFLESSLRGVDKVFFFLSSTFPSTSVDSLELEIYRTLRGLDYLLRKMRECGVNAIVFPSSGGTVYGNIPLGAAKEDDLLKPVTPYGVGKKMCEEILGFYSQFGINSTILRVGNVYGSSLVRTASQGVIEVFIQKALSGDVATIWGDACSNVRDYIFLDDFAEAVERISEFDSRGVEIYNLSSGIGTSLQEIIDAINRHTNNSLAVEKVKNDVTSSIKRIVLDMEKFKNTTGWTPRYDIDAGILETINRKTNMRFIV